MITVSSLSPLYVFTLNSLYVLRHCVIFPGRGRLTTSQTCLRWFDSLQEDSSPFLLSKQMSVFSNNGVRPSPSPLAFFGVVDNPSDTVRLHFRAFPPNAALESLSCRFGWLGSCQIVTLTGNNKSLGCVCSVLTWLQVAEVQFLRLPPSRAVVSG